MDKATCAPLSPKIKTGTEGIELIRYIDFKNHDTQIAVYGDGIWVGGANSTTNFGDFTILGTPKNGILSYEDWLEPKYRDVDQCKVALRRIGKFIYTTDNGKCGGTNVRFSGLYRYRFSAK